IIYDAPGIDRRVYGRAEGVNICDAPIYRRVIDTAMLRKTNKQTVSWVQDEIVLIGRDSVHRHGRLLWSPSHTPTSPKNDPIIAGSITEGSFASFFEDRP